MRAILEVTDNDVKFAESILLKEGQTFDKERIDFIKNFERIRH